MTKKIINKLSQLFPDYLSDSKTNTDSVAKFLISYQNLNIGELELKDGIWKFFYSDDFKNQVNLAPLPEFPDINKVYSSQVLWTFFVVRIPGLKQPHIQDIIHDENIDANNEVELLKRFGKRTISNPYELSIA